MSYYITFLQADACTYHYIKAKRITWLETLMNSMIISLIKRIPLIEQMQQGWS